VSGVNVAETPATNPKEYRRLRDELWGAMRTWLETRRGRIWDNDDNELLGELTSPKYEFTHDGKYIIEAKDRMKKRGVASPNIADAHIMTFAMPVQEYMLDKEEDMYFERDSGYRPVDAEAGY
jgi:hypothetical protein